MGKKFLPPILALLGGAAGFALRKWQLSSGFEADTGLAIPGAPAAAAVMALSALVLLLLLLLCRKEEATLDWEAAFAAGRQNALAATALVLSAMLLLASGGVEIVARSVNGLFYEVGTPFLRTTVLVLSTLRIILSIGALPCVFLWARAILRGEGGKECLATLEPCLLYCVWLISTYQTRSADPMVQDYLYEVFAISASLLGLYYIAGHSFGNGKPRRTLFFCLAGAYFSLVTLADSHALADSFRYLFAALYLTAHAALILNRPPVEPQEQTTPAEAETEADENA